MQPSKSPELEVIFRTARDRAAGPPQLHASGTCRRSEPRRSKRALVENGARRAGERWIVPGWPG